MIEIFKHKDIDQNLLLDIVNIKQLSWDFSIDQHIEWIRLNIKEDDYHFLFWEDDELVAYMNLVQVFINNKKKMIPFLGIGNVCTKYKGRGDGEKLMLQLNIFLKENNRYGILFCRHELVNFYIKYNWQLIHNLYPKQQIYTLIYNYDDDYSEFAYNDRLF